MCETWDQLKEKYLSQEQELVAAGVRVAVVYSEFGHIFRGEGRGKQQREASKKPTRIKVYNWTQFLQLGSDIDNRVIIKKMVK